MLDYTYTTAIIGNIITFVAGTALTWTSPTLEKLSHLNDNPLNHILSTEERSWITSLSPLGAVFGPFLFGLLLADKIGRKLTILLLGVPFLIGYFTLAFATRVELYYFARFLVGLGVGGVFTVLPMYIGEIASDSNRGALGSILNCLVTAGLFFTYCVGPHLSILVFNVILGIIPACFMVVFWFVAPESPHYCASKSNMEAAKTSLAKLRGVSNSRNDEELNEIIGLVESAGKGSFTDIFRSKGLIKALIISVALVGFQQFSGINAVLSFTEQIFKATGSSMKGSNASMIVGAVQFGTSFLTPFIVDRLGRKLLLYISAIGMILAEVPLGIFFYLQDGGHNVDVISWLPILAMIFYIITYNFGFGPLPWAIMGELFPSNVKSIASSVTAGFCWFLAFLITYYFESISDKIGMGVSFWIFSGFCFAAFLFTLLFVVETKGKNTQEILDVLNS